MNKPFNPLLILPFLLLACSNEDTPTVKTTQENNPETIESGKVLVIDGNEETNTSVFIENKYYDELMEKVFRFIN